MSKAINLREMKEEATKEPVVLKEEKKYTEREISFNVDYNSPEGELLSARVTSKILDGKGRTLKARVMAQLLGGYRPDSLWQDDLYRMEAISRVATQIVDLPEWLDKWVQEDNELLVRVSSILSEHETRYFRLDDREGEGSEKSARISIVSPFSEKE